MFGKSQIKFSIYLLLIIIILLLLLLIYYFLFIYLLQNIKICFGFAFRQKVISKINTCNF